MDILHRAILDTKDYIGPLRDAVRAQEELVNALQETNKTANDAMKNAGKTASEYDSAVKKSTSVIVSATEERKKLLRAEIQDYVELNTAKKKAFSPEEVKQFNDRIKETKERIELLKSAEGKGGGLIETLIKKEKDLLAARERSNNPIATERFNQKLVETRSELDKLTNTAGKGKGAFSDIFGSALGQFTAVAIGATVVSKAFGGLATAKKDAEDYGKSLSSLSSITGATGKDLEDLDKRAEGLADTFKKPQREIVETFKLIGSAKPELLANAEGLEAVSEAAITLSKASGDELKPSAESLVSVLNQFQEPATEATRIMNALAAGAKAGASEIPDTAAAIERFGVSAASSNVSVEESIGLVQTLAEFNLKGAEAGTSLRNVLGKLSAVDALPKDAKDQLEKFGVNLEIVSNKTLPLTERLREFSKISGDSTALVKVFGEENRIAGEIILNNISKFDGFTKAVTGTNTAVEQAAINMDNAAGDSAALDAEIGALSLSFGRWLETGVRPGIQLLTAFIKGIRTLPSFLKENKDLFFALGAALVAFNLQQTIATALTIRDAVAKRASLVWSAAVTVATNLNTAAMAAFNAVASANPLGILVRVALLLAGAFAVLYERSQTVRAGVAGLVEVSKVAFKILVDAFSAFGRAFDQIKSGDIKGAMKSIGQGIIDANPINLAIKAGSQLGDAFNKGYNDKINSEKDAKKVKVETEEEKKLKLFGANFTPEQQEEEDKKRLAAQKKAADARKKLMDDLNKELLDLEKRYNSARLQMVEKDSEEYLQIRRQESLNEIEELAKRIRDKENLLRRAGGRGESADGKLSVEQEQQLSVLRLAVEKEYNDGYTKLVQAREQRIFDLQLDSDKKQIDAVNRKYDALLKAAKGNAAEEIAIVAARGNEIDRLTAQQKSSRLEREEGNVIAGVQNKIRDRGVDRATQARADEEQILDIQLEYAQKQLEVYASLNEAIYGEDKRALQQRIDAIKKAQDELGRTAKPFSIDTLFGLEEGTMEAIETATGAIVGSIKQVMEAELQSIDARLNATEEAIDEKEQALDRELELRAQGFASDVQGERERLAELKKQRNEQLEERRKQVRAQQALETVEQIGNLITSSTNIFKALSPIPFVGVPLAIASIAAMFGAFIAVKAQAASVSKLRYGGEIDPNKGGRVDGPMHEQGGVIVEAEGGEFVTRRESYRKHRALVEAINKDKFVDLPETNLSIQQILRESKIMPSFESAEQAASIHNTYVTVVNTGKTESLLEEVRDNTSKLTDIVKNTGRIPKKHYFRGKDETIIVSDGRTDIIKD